MIRRGALILGLKWRNGGCLQLMKVYLNTVVLLGLPGNEGRVLEFGQEALSRRQRGISWPTVGYFKVKSIVGAKARGNGST
jgi:hypothetical protein